MFWLYFIRLFNNSLYIVSIIFVAGDYEPYQKGAAVHKVWINQVHEKVYLHTRDFLLLKSIQSTRIFKYFQYDGLPSLLNFLAIINGGIWIMCRIPGT